MVVLQLIHLMLCIHINAEEEDGGSLDTLRGGTVVILVARS